MAGWRALGLTWAALAGLLLAGFATLQWLGPPPAPNARGHAAAAGIAPPDPALLEPYAAEPGRVLPKVASDGRAPFRAYAAAFEAPPDRPRVGLILAGVGLDRAASEAAIRALPAGITLAISPYSADPEPVLQAARATGHEYLLSLPMQPTRAPLDDAGPESLQLASVPAETSARLEWALSRIAGYVGVTSVLGRLTGQAFERDADAMRPVLETLARRGLIYVGDPPQAAAPKALHVLRPEPPADEDEDEGAAGIDSRLAALSQRARRDGSAIGVIGAVRPVSVLRIAAWAQGLSAQGLALAPVSAFAR